MRGISKSFPGVKALDQVDVALYPGTVTALIGENGAGKSTLVKILTGIYQPDGGEIVVDGVAGRISRAPRRRSEPASRRSTRKPFSSTSCRWPKTSFSATRRETGSGLVNWAAMNARAAALLTLDRRADQPLHPAEGSFDRAAPSGRHCPRACPSRPASSSWTSRPPRSPTRRWRTSSASSSG